MECVFGRVIRLKGKKMEEKDDRREAAIASAAESLNPKLAPSSSVSHARLSKFQELHKRRLQIKEKAKIKKKSKGRSSGPTRLQEKDSHTEETLSEIQCKKPQDTTSHSIDLQEDVAPQKAIKKPQKLHWGLDTKERWERKSNM